MRHGSRRSLAVPFLVLFAISLPRLAPACSLCVINIQQTTTLREEAGQAKFVLFGSLANARLNPGGTTGVTEFRVGTVLKGDRNAKLPPVLELPRYVPTESLALVFCDVVDDKVDLYRGVLVASKRAMNYAAGFLAINPKDRLAALQHAFGYLEDADKEIAADAFLEFAKATDQELAGVGAKLAPEKLRAWVKDPKTPGYRLGVYAFLLGCCGEEEDAQLLRSLVEKPTEQTSSALDGILGGYIRKKPEDGWKLALGLLGDEKKPFTIRYAVVRLLRFAHSLAPKESEKPVRQGMALAVMQGDLADLAVEELRKWQAWDLAPTVVGQYGKKSHSAPIVRRAIIRYALSCPRTEAADFVTACRKQEPDVVRQVEESLEYERP